MPELEFPWPLASPPPLPPSAGSVSPHWPGRAEVFDFGCFRPYLPRGLRHRAGLNPVRPSPRSAARSPGRGMHLDFRPAVRIQGSRRSSAAPARRGNSVGRRERNSSLQGADSPPAARPALVRTEERTPTR